MKAIGTMSGTSLDGVDVALLETDGEILRAFGPTGYRAYREDERALLRNALSDAANLIERNARPGALADAEAMLTQAHNDAIRQFMHSHGIAPDDIDVVGFHGQTALHRPERALTVQLGDGAALARSLGRPVVFDFRAADVAAGGQGAPFVPVYHRALTRSRALAEPLVVVNIGGVANVTYIEGETLIACDTGPGNALLDDFMLKTAGRAMDVDGAIAARGRPDRAWIAHALALPFFARPAPKSLDRNDFAELGTPSGSVEDVAATLTDFTAAALADAVKLLPKAPTMWIVAGGGAHNPTLVGNLAARVAPAQVMLAKTFGWQGDAIEAQAFAFLAVRSLKGLPLTFPGTTGVASPLGGGVLAKA